MTAASPVHTHPAQRRTLVVLVSGQLFAGMGLAAGVAVGPILAAEMLGGAHLAGLPLALLTGGSAIAALAIGRVSQARGRRIGLGTGFGLGALGAIGIVVATLTGSVALLLGSFAIYGAGTAANLQARYAGADLAAPEHRGKALSTVLLGTTLGAIAGPNLTTPTGHVAESIGFPAATGPFLLAAFAYGMAALVLTTLLRPDPLLEARRMDAERAETSRAHASGPATAAAGSPAAAGAAGSGGSSPESGSVWTRAVLTGVVVMALTQFVMVALMTMTPVHMAAHDHTTTAVGIVISLHIAAMFLPAPLSGALVDRLGPRTVSISAGVVLLASAAAAIVVPDDSVAGLAVALILLGLGWSLGLVAGTTVLSSEVPVERRAATQGTADVAVAVAGAVGALGSGLVFGWIDFAGLSTVLGICALVIVPIVAFQRERVGG